MKERKGVIIGIITIVIIIIISVVGGIVYNNRKISEYIKNGEFSNANKMCNNLYTKYKDEIYNSINNHIDNNKLTEAFKYYNNFVEYMLGNNKIEYSKDEQLYSKYTKIENQLSSDMKDIFWKMQYQYIKTQSQEENTQEIEFNLISYDLLNKFLENDKYKEDNNMIYTILTTKYNEIKKRDNDCTTSELEILKDMYEKLGEYEQSKAFVEEIKEALRWQGSWVSEDTKEPEQLAISYFGKNIFDDYIFNGAYRYKGVYKFENTEEDVLEIKKSSGEPHYSSAKLKFDNNNIILVVHFVWGDEEYKFVRESVDNNYINNANKVLSSKPKEKTKPQVGMTEEEVLSSTWGYPNKKNKDTYTWGTTEQWVYDNYGYVYFRNGIVSSISER